MTNLHDIIHMPGFNWVTQNNRGDWGTRCVTDGSVTPDPAWGGKPVCIEHGAMNAVSETRDLWRCLACGRAVYMGDNPQPEPERPEETETQRKTGRAT